MYWLAIYPVDQVKSAIMCDSLNASERVYPNMATAIRVSYLSLKTLVAEV